MTDEPAPWRVLPFSVARFDGEMFALCRAVPYLDHLLCWIEEAQFPARRENRMRRNWHAEIAATGGFAIRLPGTGVALVSGRSVMLADKTVFFGVRNRPDLILAASRVGLGQPLTSVVLPGARVVVNVNGPKWNVTGVQAARAVALFARAAAGWSDAPPPARLLVTGDNNYAHHMWNQLGALDGILALGVPVDVAATHQPIAPIEAIFADRPGLTVRPIAPDDLPGLDPRLVLPYPGGGLVVLAGVRARISRVAGQRAGAASRAILAATDGMRRIWLTLRVGSRTALNLVDALAAIAQSLLADERYAIVLDGFSRPNDYAANPAYDKASIEQTIAQERAVAQVLRAKVAQMAGVAAAGRLHVAVGFDLLESIHLASHCHAYFAHHGTLQHKLGYFTRVPGLVHSNPAVLATDFAATHRHVTEDAGRVDYIDAALVRDVPGALGAMREDNNYRFVDIAGLARVFGAFVAGCA